MNIWKRFTALLLSVACVCALCVPPASAAEVVSTFPDITDPQVGRAVEALRTMGVVSGNGKGYDPQGNLTRAQFCKMAILVMGKGDEAKAQASRTIFTDVPGKHWARGYVNLAASGVNGSRLMMGLGNGCFAPDRAITYGEAVTTLLRILGYTKEANSNWPNGAVSTAASIGLTEGFTPPAAGGAISRAQAAILFCNMLTAPVSGSGGSDYLSSLGYRVEKGALLLSRNATVNGQSGLVRIFTKDGEKTSVKPAGRAPAAFLEGTQGIAVFNNEGLFLTFLPDANAVSKSITVASAAGGALTATDGTRLTPSSNTPVWKEGEAAPTEYARAHTSIQPGTSITVCYNAAGAIEYLFVRGTAMSLSGGVMAARDPVSGNPFAQLTAGTSDYKIVKNGAAAALSDLKQYDVAAYDPTAKTLYVTDFRLTGIYEAASPNTAMPTKITVFGKEFDVLDSAVDDLKDLKLNSSVTLLLSPDGKVAGAVSSSVLRSNTVGYVDESGTVRLLNAPNDALSTATGTPSGSLSNYQDCLVTVTGTANNGISLSRLTSRAPAGALNLRTRMLGESLLADNLAVFEKVGTGAIRPISLASIVVSSVPAAKIAYYRTNSAGKVDLLVLDDVTGDLYTYGIVSNDTQPGGYGDMQYTNHTTTVTNGNNNSLTVVGGTTYRDGQFIGLAASTSKIDGTPRAAASVALKSVEKVTPANFNLTTGLFFSGSVELPIWDGVQCYNAQTKSWFAFDENQPLKNLNDCLAYSGSLTVYYDRDPAQGGKVRIVVAN